MELFYQSYGTNGPPLLILHGLLGTLDNWQSLSKRFSDTFQVFAIDLRNHGRSPHSAEFNYRVMAEDVNEFIDRHHLQSAVNIIGHSMGGKIAMQFALTHPEKCGKLVIVNIAPCEYEKQHDEILQTLVKIDLASVSSRREVESLMAKDIPQFAMRQFLLKNLKRNTNGSFSWKMNLDAIKNNYRETLRAIDSPIAFKKPALFIRGENSDYIRENDIPGIEKLFPNSTFETILNAGHWVHAEAPEKFFEVVHRFLNIN